MKNKEKDLKLLNEQLKSLIKGEEDWLANLANASALLYNQLDEINWAGFYLLKGGELVLGPFQGLPACIRIKYGEGVCGSAIRDKRTYLVPDVHDFPGHIACDPASESELVIPLIKDNNIFGVMDIDSPVKNRFDDIDKKYLEEFAEILVRGSNLNKVINEEED